MIRYIPFLKKTLHVVGKYHISQINKNLTDGNFASDAVWRTIALKVLAFPLFV